MAARASWTGALTFAGFPIHLSAFPTTKGAESFKGLCPCHTEPITQVKRCAHDATVIAHDDLLIGVEPTKGTYVPLDKAAIDAIKGPKSEIVEIASVSPRDSIDFAIATASYTVAPNPKVPGSEGPANILWNGLREHDLVVVVAEWVMRAGSRPQTLIIHADNDGLRANAMPSEVALNDAPKMKVAVDQDAAQMFGQVVQAQYQRRPFDLADYPDTYAERRAQLIEDAINGKTPVVTQAAAPTPVVPDLMAAMQASLGAAKPAAAKSDAPAPTPEVTA